MGVKWLDNNYGKIINLISPIVIQRGDRNDFRSLIDCLNSNGI